MMTKVPVPAHTLALQREATTPKHSAWVEANAGSGKTHVLTGRLIRLMLSGVPPDKILCLTFTEAAAAEMANRVFERLSAWTSCHDAVLYEALADVLGRAPDASERLNARCLFARALESPGGLKIQTLHSFAERILHQFPLEASVWPDFSVLDAGEADLLKRQAIDDIIGLSEEGDQSSSPLATLQHHMSSQSIQKILETILHEREAFHAMVKAQGGLIAAGEALAPALGIDPSMQYNDFNSMILDSPYMPVQDWPDLAEALNSIDQKTMRKRADDLKQAYNLVDSPQGVKAYIDVFCGQDQIPYKAKSFTTKAFQETYPKWHERFMAEHERVSALVMGRKMRACYDITQALYQWGAQVIVRYSALKSARHGLDFADLIEKAAHLLQDEGAAWVHYKLDRGIDHILVDEAQDTSPQQWTIIDQLAGEFYAGKGAQTQNRTLFVVGDKKQSIYRFQGVDPALFQSQSRHYQRHFKQAGLGFVTTPLTLSFRSSPKIMELVMAVFAEGLPALAVGGDRGVAEHVALPSKKGGKVSLWPLARGTRNENPPDLWQGKIGDEQSLPCHVELAHNIAAYIKTRLDNHDRLPSGRVLTAKDCLILVQQRSPLFWAIIQALKQVNVPLAGADRLILTDHLAVQDLLALGRAMLMPFDDLNLAAVLKSPLFGLDEAGLFSLAHKREGRLIDALIRRAKTDEHVQALYERFKRWQSLARRASPFAFYHHVLSVDGGMKALYGRLGYEAEEAILVFLDQVAEAETKGISTLRRFMDFCQREAREVKRQISKERNEVRVMTVHGAKGLESSLVIVADTIRVPDRKKIPQWLNLGNEKGALFAWYRSAKEPHQALNARREAYLGAEKAEYYRLLYVALTRAEEEVIIAGALPKKNKSAPEESWYATVERALKDELTETHNFGQDTLVWRYEQADTPLNVKDKQADEKNLLSTRLPAWLSPLPSPKREHQPIMLKPSQPLEPLSFETNNNDYENHQLLGIASAILNPLEAKERGIAIHHLLERWCKLDDERKISTLPRLIKAYDRLQDEQNSIQDYLSALWHNPHYAWIFKKGGLNEATCAGKFLNKKGVPVTISGVIDRLIHHEGRLWLIDFKTGQKRDNPTYQHQLACYWQVLAARSQDKNVSAALFWFEERELEVLDIHQARKLIEADGLTPEF